VERCLACEADRSETLVGRGSRTADRSDQRREMSRCQSASLRRKARRAAGLGGVSAQSEKHAIDPRLGKRPDVSRAASPFSTSPPLKPLGRGEPRPTRLGGTRQTRAATFVICYLLFVIAAKRPASPHQDPTDRPRPAAAGRQRSTGHLRLNYRLDHPGLRFGPKREFRQHIA
jgi:hypothetical protein